jgi:23S rRNA pseudouridine955/2504/2580 synthase
MILRVLLSGLPLLLPPNPGRTREYTRKTAVETNIYDEVEVIEPQPGPLSDEKRSGVRQIEVDSEAAGTRLDQFLMRLLTGVPRSRVFRIVRKGEVRVNGKRARPEQRLQERDTVRIPPVRLEEEPAPGEPARVPSRARETIESAIVSEDDRLIVLDKPAGVAVHGGSGLSFGVIEALRAMRPDEELELVHRLDRETSGCLLVARRRSALRTLHELMREGLVEKRYLTLVRGHWNLGHTKIDAPLRTDIRVGGERTVKVNSSGKEALSEFKPIQWFGNQATLLEVSLHTGRTHQIRVHAAHAGHPVAGDEKYGDETFNEVMKAAGLNRMFLHSHSVSFEWPQGAHGGLFSASAPLPTELSAVIDALSGSAARTATRPPRWGSKEASAQKRRSARREGTGNVRFEARNDSWGESLGEPADSQGPSGERLAPANRSARESRAARPAQPGGRRAGRQRTRATAGAGDRPGGGRAAPGGDRLRAGGGRSGPGSARSAPGRSGGDRGRGGGGGRGGSRGPGRGGQGRR